MTLDISPDLVERMTKNANNIWEMRKKAESAISATPEAILLKSLSDKWSRANRRIEAVKLLLSGQLELMEDIAVA